MPESIDEEFNRIRKEIDDITGQDTNNIVKFTDPELVNPDRGDTRLRSFGTEDGAIQYAAINGDENRTYAVLENEETGKYEVWEMGNPNLNLNEGQLNPEDEHRRDFEFYEDAYEYISEIGAGASYFGIVDEGDGLYGVYFLTG